MGEAEGTLVSDVRVGVAEVAEEKVGEVELDDNLERWGWKAEWTRSDRVGRGEEERKKTKRR